MENKEQITPWQYQGRKLTPEDIPEWAVGFIYKVIKQYGEYDEYDWRLVYVGKKNLTTNRKKKIGIRAQAKQKAETGDGRVKKVTRVVKSSGWEDYLTSCKELQEAIKESPDKYERHVIEWCYSKKNMTYNELKYQFLYDVLEIDTFNRNINGSLYRHDTNRELYEQYREEQKNKPRKPRVKKEPL